ncbi:MAG: hypothetical protein ACRDMY_11330 [Gaiellaceae bacterium]
METENTQHEPPQEPEETDEGSPVPDPEGEDPGDAEDVPTAD